MAVVTTNLGVVTAYGDAVRGGYTGTKEQWEALMADYGTIGTQAQADAQTASTAAQTATTKASEASASATQAQQAAASVSTPDTTLTQSGKAADAKATGDEISSLKEDLTSNVNIKIADMERHAGFMMNTGKWGNFGQANPYKHVVIHVNGGETYKITGNTTSGYNTYVGFLASYSVPSDGDNIDYATGASRMEILANTTYTGTLPSDTRYVVVIVVYNGQDRTPSVCKIDRLDYVLSGYGSMVKAIDEAVIEAESRTINDVLSPNGIIEHIGWASGTFTQAVGSTSTNSPNVNRQRTEMLVYDVNVTVKGTSPYGFNVCLYDADNKFIGYADSNVYRRNDVIVSAGQKFRLVTANASNTSTDISAVDMSQYVNVVYSGLATIIHGGADTKWCAMGDSITEGYISYNTSPYYKKSVSDSWVFKLQQITGLTVANYGIGGTGFLRANTGETDAGWNVVSTIDFTKYDFVTIAYGVNDWKYNMPLGTFDDFVDTDTNPTTIYSAMRYVIEKIITDNPLCKIFVLMPINCSAVGTEANNWGIGYAFTNNGTLEQIYTAFKTVCEYYGIEYIDMLHNSIVNRKNIQTCLIDGVHPSADTHTVLAHEIGSRIRWKYN